MKVCTVCGEKHYARGLCKVHYRMPSQLNPKPIKRGMPVGDFQMKLVNKKPNKPRTPSKLEEKSLKELKELCQIIVNRYVRKRDTRLDGTFKCICCGIFFSAKEMDAGHMISVRHQATRFDLMNIHGQSTACNRLEYGRQKEYIENLVSLYGESAVEALEMRSKKTKHWTKEELVELIKKYKVWP